ncbi:MAG: hypothetical protein ACK4KT_06745 [Thermaurantimonas sp.]
MLERLRHHPAWPSTLVSLYLLIYISVDKRWIYSPVIEWDVCSYYSYIKGLLYEGDPYLRIWNVDSNRMQLYTYSSPHSEKMTGGMALLYLPAVAAAHLYAHVAPEFMADGISHPYRVALQYNVIVYLWVGFFTLYLVLYRIIRKHWPVFLSLLSLFFGTNLLYYSAVENAMSHAYTFSLFSLWLFLSQEWLMRPRAGIAVAMGLLAGLIVWIRPVNLVLLPSSLGLQWLMRKEDRSTHVRAKLPVHLAIIACFGFAMLIPQMIYWKITEGQWLVYSYGEESFFFLSPKIIDGLFSWRKGWLIYCPFLLILVPGFVAVFRRSRKGGAWILGFVVLFLYITFSWWCWWYGGGYSQRSLIDILPLLAIPIAFAWNLVPRFMRLVRLGVVILLCGLIGLNIFHVWQYKHYLIHYDSNTKKSYFINFLRKTHAPGWWEALEAPDYDAARIGCR